MNPKQLNKCFHKLRRKLKLQKPEIAHQLGVNFETFTSWIVGRRQPPRDMLNRLADLLQASADEREELLVAAGYTVAKPVSVTNGIVNLYADEAKSLEHEPATKRAGSLINRSRSKRYLLDTATALRHHTFTRVSPEVLDHLEAKIKDLCRAVVLSQPSTGKTIRV